MSLLPRLLPLLVLIASGAAQSQDRGEDIQLVCYGGAEKTTSEVHSGFEWDAQQHKYVPKQSVETGKSDFQATINVSVHGDRAEIQLPKSLIPALHGDSNNGWWGIDDLIVGHDEIRGQFRLNGLNKPRLSINRRSGAITIDGMIKFSGRCDPDDGHRRF
ncbi:hypothetical protein GTP46_16365 [Duganella sp. FT135W]|uniref:Uncharacterized protein n=1 Tax=Duganella flavida TaxID=2692175 RepID=A0A6L8KEH3_9BURK|nr:hypothetical protein [Duganella flavida]MYM24222.1 hypothetical protein [Duganella flavida]